MLGSKPITPIQSRGIDRGGGRGERHGPITPPNPMMAKKLKLFV